MPLVLNNPSWLPQIGEAQTYNYFVGVYAASCLISYGAFDELVLDGG